jgi:hypothetical protein
LTAGGRAADDAPEIALDPARSTGTHLEQPAFATCKRRERLMAEMKTYQGGCHCGAVRYEAETDLGAVIECNCSHCYRKGFLLTFVPVERFRLLSGDGELTEYRFNKKQIAHLFCRVCGVQSFARGRRPDGVEMRGVNVRCLEGVDPASLTVTPVDGKSF